MGQCAHLRNYATLPECCVVALAEIRPEHGRRVAARYGVKKVYTSYSQMLNEETLDAVVASQLFTRHGSLVPELLKWGLPVFIEKPLAGTIEMGQKIVDAAQKSGTFVMVGYHKRSDPAMIWAHEQIDRLKASGELGPLQYVRLLMPAGEWMNSGFFDLIQSDEPIPALDQDPPDRHMDKSLYDEYIGFVNYYIHQVNLLRHLVGESYEVTHAEPSGVLLVGRGAGGVACTIEMSPYTSTREWEESALIAFRHGYLKIELPAPLAINRPGRVELYWDKPGAGNMPTRSIPTLPWDHAMRQQARNFIKAVTGQAEPPCAAAEALEDLRVARQYLRLKTGQ